MLGKPGGYSRPPTLPFTDERRAELRQILAEIGLLTPAGVAQAVARRPCPHGPR